MAIVKCQNLTVEPNYVRLLATLRKITSVLSKDCLGMLNLIMYVAGHLFEL